MYDRTEFWNIGTHHFVAVAYSFLKGFFDIGREFVIIEAFRYEANTFHTIDSYLICCVRRMFFHEIHCHCIESFGIHLLNLNHRWCDIIYTCIFFKWRLVSFMRYKVTQWCEFVAVLNLVDVFVIFRTICLCTTDNPKSWCCSVYAFNSFWKFSFPLRHTKCIVSSFCPVCIGTDNGKCICPHIIHRKHIKTVFDLWDTEDDRLFAYIDPCKRVECVEIRANHFTKLRIWKGTDMGELHHWTTVWVLTQRHVCHLLTCDFHQYKRVCVDIALLCYTIELFFFEYLRRSKGSGDTDKSTN